MVRLIVLCCAFLSLVACASSSHKAIEATSYSGLKLLSGSQLSDAARGDSIAIDGLQATVVDSYVAASGRQCKTLVARADNRIRAACQVKSGQWYLRDPLMGPAATSATANSHTTIVPVTPDLGSDNQGSAFVDSASIEQSLPVEVIVLDEEGALRETKSTTTEVLSQTGSQPRIAINDKESMWNFSKRVTGNALYWQKIARYNNVKNPALVQPGTRLSIPPDLNILDGVEFADE